MNKKNLLTYGLLTLAAGAYFGTLMVERALDNKIGKSLSAPGFGEFLIDPGKTFDNIPVPAYQAQTTAGKYLSAIFAQNLSDWNNAFIFFDSVLKDQPENNELKQRVMMLALGAGQFDRAGQLARELYKKDPGQPIVSVMLTLENIRQNNFEKAQDSLKSIPGTGIGALIKPFLQAWISAAGKKVVDTSILMQTGSYYHAFLVSDYLGKGAEFVTTHQKELDRIEPYDLERIADILSAHSNFKEAEKLYQLSAASHDGNDRLKRKLDSLKIGQIKKDDLIALPVTSPAEGMAEALYDIAVILVREGSDETGHIFARLALSLAPQKTSAKVLLAVIATKGGRLDDAIDLYKTIPANDVDYIEAQQRIASLLEQSDRSTEALKVLQAVITKSDDIETLISLGDLYRHQENYKEALDAYNKAFAKLNNKIPAEHWELLYARGIALERLKRWPEAEKDFQAALAYQPDHPYVLNYLAYTWVDQGVNIDQSLEMLKRAVRLKPDDGFITDSLGWAYYRAGKFTEATEYLELAIALVPYDATINDHLGDAYWQVGRKREAEFQWKRALNAKNIEPEIKLAIEEKLANGLTTHLASTKSDAPKTP